MIGKGQLMGKSSPRNVALECLILNFAYIVEEMCARDSETKTTVRSWKIEK